MQILSGSISFAHVEDVSRAQIFVAETESASGRYVCCAANTGLPELAEFMARRYPQHKNMYQVSTHWFFELSIVSNLATYKEVNTNIG